MDHLDLDRWARLLDAERDATDAMPAFIALQDSQARVSVARNMLANFKTNGPRGSVNGSPPRAPHDGERILDGGMGRHGPDDIRKAFDSSVRELEQRLAAAEHDARRIADRHHQCGERLATVRRLVEQCRVWAAEQGAVLPGDDGRVVSPPGLPSVHIAGPAPGTHDFLGRPT